MWDPSIRIVEDPYQRATRLYRRSFDHGSSVVALTHFEAFWEFLTIRGPNIDLR